MEIIYADNNKDLIRFYDVIKFKESYKVYERNIESNITEVIFNGTLNECINHITNIINQ